MCIRDRRCAGRQRAHDLRSAGHDAAHALRHDARRVPHGARGRLALRGEDRRVRAVSAQRPELTLSLIHI